MESKYNSPGDSVAAKALVKTQTGITRIKEIITSARIQSWTDDELTKRLNKAISDCCKGFDNAFLKEAVRKSLVNSARKWNWLLKNSIEVYNKNLLQKAKLDDFNYTVDVSALMQGKEGVTRKEFRNTLNTGTALGKPLIRDYRRSVTIALRALSAEPPLVAQMKDGKVRKISLRNVAEMTVRHEASLHDIEKMRAKGVIYVWTTSHPNCSPRCAKFQGKLWSLNNTSGTLEGNKYRPIEIALNGPLHDGNGIISGYNCRHRLVVWFPGSKSPVEYTEAKIKKAYAIDQKQRAYENNIRQMKLEEKLMRAAGDEEHAIALRKKWRTATQNYKLYSLENNRPYYMYRCMVDASEMSHVPSDYAEQQKIFVEYTPQATRKEAEEWVRSKGIEVSYKGIDIKVANSMNESLNRAMQYCPDIKKNMGYFGSGKEGVKKMRLKYVELYTPTLKERNPFVSEERLLKFAKKKACELIKPLGENTLARASANKKWSELGGILVNDDFGKDYEEFSSVVSRNVMFGFHPVGTESVKAIFDHEFGHQLDYALNLRKNQDMISLFDSYTKDEIQYGLSEYAMKGGIAEFIAEGYAEYVNNSDPREIAMKIGAIIEQEVNKHENK